jgi:AAA domain/Zinc knuckle
LAIALKLQSKKLKDKEKRPQIVYTTSTNMSVDDAARRYAALATEHGMTDLKIIRAHSPKSEKAKVFHGKGRKSRFLKLDDSLLNEFLATAYVSELGQRKHGDRRRVVEELSLAAAMIAFMNNNLHDLAFRTLKSQLNIAAKEGMTGLDRTQIRAQVNELMSRTLRDADAIFCTLNAITKGIMIENLNPVLMINDDSCRATELAVLALFAHYNALVYMFLGDPNQLGPVVLSAGREKDFYDLPYLNPFYLSAGKSFLERMMQCGHPVTMLIEQFRCHGGNAYFAIKSFYYGMVKDVNAQKAMLPAVEALRRYIQKILKLPKGSNLVLYAIQHSRSFRQTGGTSTENPDHVTAVLDLVDDLCDYKEFTSLDQTRPGTVTIAPMYRAQVSGYNKGLQRSKTIDRSRVKVRTIDGMQGYEDDVVIVDLTRAQGVGFTGQKNRFTVACTRAIQLLVIAVNPEMLANIENSAKLESTKYIDRLLSFCQFTKKDYWVIADSFICKNCKKPGHSSRDCPQPKPCHNCKKTGHEAADCTEPRNMTRVNCRNCGGTGHFARGCPTPKIPFCNRCKVLGHLKQDESCPTQPDYSNLRCHKCGMLGHMSNKCNVKLTLRQLHTARQDQRKEKGEQ